MNLIMLDMMERRIADTDAITSCVHTETHNENTVSIVGYGIPAITKYVAFEDIAGDLQMFEVRTRDEDEITGETTLYAENIYYELVTDFPIEDIRPTNTTAAVATAQALSGTRWQIGIVTSGNYATSTRWYYISPMQALSDVREKWGIRFKFRVTASGTKITGRYVDVLSAVPVWRGKRYEIGKDILTAKYTIDDRTVVTAIIGRGKGEETGDGYGRRIDFSDIVWSKAKGDPADKPSGQKWIEDPEATASYGVVGTRPRVTTKVYSDIEDKTELLQATWEDLKRSCQPILSATLTVIDLEKMGFPHEAARLGDEVALVVNSVRARSDIVSIKRDYAASGKDVIQLGAMRDSISSRLANVQRDLNSTTTKAAAGAAIAQVNASLLDGYLDTMATRILSSGTNMYTDTSDGGLVLENAKGTSAVKITGSGILIASSKTAGKWDWSTAMDGYGIVAGAITTGILRTSLIQILGTDRFLWDAKNIYIYTDEKNKNKQIRIGCFDESNRHGIGFTSDGGVTWNQVIDEKGYQVDLTEYITNDQFTEFRNDVEFQISAEQIVSKVRSSTQYKGDLSALGGRIDEAEQKITPTAIVNTVRSSTAYKGDINGLGDRLSEAEQKITASAIVSTVRGSSEYKGDIGGLGDRLSQAEQKITATAIVNTVRGSSAYQGDIGGLDDRLSEAEQKITSSAIISTVRNSSAYQGDLSTKSTTYYGSSAPLSPNAGDLWMDSANNNIMKRYSGTSWQIVQDGEISTLVQSTSGLVAAVGNNRLRFSSSGLDIINASGITVFKQDSNTGALDITGIIRALGGTIGPLSISSYALTYGSQFSIDTSYGYPRIKIGNLLLKYVNSSTQFGLIYGPEEAPYFAVSDNQAYFGRAISVTPSAMPTQLQGTLMTYNRSTGQVGSGYKIAHGSVVINDSTKSDIYYGGAGFTQAPNIVATYSKLGANASGDCGPIKVYDKTAYGATLIIGGTFPQFRDVDWIAIGM